jgi:hypothetical protein
MARRRRRNRADYNRAVDLIRPGTDTNAFNERVEGGPFELVARTFAKITPVAGAEPTEGDQPRPMHTHRVHTPRIPSITITTDMQVRYHDGQRERLFDIAAVGDELEDHDALVLQCVERA